jgi:hypothetical protein
VGGSGPAAAVAATAAATTATTATAAAHPTPGSPASRAVPVVAGAGDAFEDVLARVRAAGRGGAAVDLVVARESGLLLTAGEFRALREAIDRERLAVTLRCDDALRDGLARAMGVERRRIPPELRALLTAPPTTPPAGPSAASAAPPLAVAPPVAFAPPAPEATSPRSSSPGNPVGPRPGASPGRAAGPGAGPTLATGPGPGSGSGAGSGPGRERGPATGAGSVSGSAAGPGASGAVADPHLAYRRPTPSEAAGEPAQEPSGRAPGAPSVAEAAAANAAHGGAPTGPDAGIAAARRTALAPEPAAGAGPPAGGWPEQPGPPPPAPPPAPPRRRPGGRFRRRSHRADPTTGAPIDAVAAAAVAAGGAEAGAEANPGGIAHEAPFEPPSATPASALVPGGPRRVGPGPEPAFEEPVGPTFDQIVAPRYRGAKRPRWLAPAMALLALAVLAALAVALLTPRATVAVALRTAPVAGEALVDVTAAGAPLDGEAVAAIAATPIEVEVAFSGAVPATGSRAEPDATAGGTVRFANPNPEAVTVPAGTEMTTGAGTVFVLAEEVSVPGADPATGQAGQGEGAIRAAAPGTGGNVGIGEIGGRLPSGVYYSNREEATAGGTDRQVPVVAAADLEALRAEADAALAEQATAAAQEQLGTGAQLLPGSATVLAGDETFSAEEGAAAAEVSLEATRTVRVLAWSPAAAQDELRGVVAGPPAPFLTGQGQVPDGWIVDPASVRFGDAVVEGGSPEGARVRLPVEALTTPRFGPDERRALAERLAGLDEAAATALLTQEPALTGAAIEFRPAWFLHRLPADPDRIEVTTTAVEGGSAS